MEMEIQMSRSRDSSRTGAHKGNEKRKVGNERGSEGRGEVVGAARSARSLTPSSVHRSIDPRRSSCSDREKSKRASGGREGRGAGKSGEGEKKQGNSETEEGRKRKSRQESSGWSLCY